MCGLFGILNIDRSPLDADKAIDLLQLLSHRGPDGWGHYKENDVFLGHTRLSIIDVEGGEQPLYSEDGRFVLIGNGEIYNHMYFRPALESKGHRFKTKSDTEILVHLFEEERENFLHKINGMFAFAIYDTETRSLFLARDRIGIKPLYYYFDGRRLIFSSEIKAIVKSGLVPLELNEAVVYQYLTQHYSIPPDTLIKGVESIKPGHYMYVADGAVEQRQYWDIESNIDDEPLSYREAERETESLLLDSVTKRLMSDVPLGLFLSGGIDSSLIAVLMHRIVGDGIKTFSIGFHEKEFSELPYARTVSKMISSDHSEIIMTPREIMDNIESVIWFRETPISQPSDIPMFLLSRAAAKKVKVVLTGEGGDEVFAGYSKYAYEGWGNLSMLLGNPVVAPLVRNRITRKFLPQKLARALELLSVRDKYKRYYKWFEYFSDEELRRMLREDAADLIVERNYYRDVLDGKSFRTRLDETQYLDVKIWLPDNLLLRGDRLSMASSLEARVPFLDHRMVELSYRLSNRSKVRGFTGKYIIKKIAEKYFERDLIYRKKVGFNVPMDDWLRNELKDFLISRITRTNSFCLSLFDKKHVDELIDDHMSGRKNYRKKLWILLNLELWHDTFLRNGKAS